MATEWVLPEVAGARPARKRPTVTLTALQYGPARIAGKTGFAGGALCAHVGAASMRPGANRREDHGNLDREVLGALLASMRPGANRREDVMVPLYCSYQI